MAAPAQVEIWIGLDVGKEFHHAVVLNDAGDVLADRRVTNSEADLVKIIDAATEHGIVGLVIDQPGSIAQLALALARQREVPVAYIPGLVMRRAADLYPGDAKTDRRDAYVIADTARTRRDQIHWLGIDDDLLVQLRVLNGLDVDLAADSTRHANRLRDALTSISPALERAIGSKLQHAGVRDLLAKYPTPTALRAAGKTRIRTVVSKRSPRMGVSITERVSKALDEQTVVVPAEATLGRVVAELAVELGRVRDRRDALEAEIEQVFLAHPLGPVLISLPGIGPRTGARILAEIGDGSGFASGSKLAAYAGLAPVTRQSGTSIRGEHRSRRGNHRLKNAMFLSAFASLNDPDSRAFYDRKRAEGKRHNAALICLARRRCDVIHAMLRTGDHYLTRDQLADRARAPKAA
jgi:transposase